MNKDLLILLLKELLGSEGSEESGSEKKEIKKYNIGEYVIVRCKDAGVHFGELVDYYDRTVVLCGSRRLWSWKTKQEHTLSGVARCGIDQSESKLSGVVDNLILLEACEIIPVTSSAALSSISECPTHNQD